jgi:hypothetical protein
MRYAICCHKLIAFLSSGSLVQWSVDGNTKSYIIRWSDSVPNQDSKHSGRG